MKQTLFFLKTLIINSSPFIENSSELIGRRVGTNFDNCGANLKNRLSGEQTFESGGDKQGELFNRNSPIKKKSV